MNKKNRSKIFILFLLTLTIFLVCFPVQAKSKVTISLNKASASVYAKETLQLKASVKGTSEKVKWSSSNNKIATVNSDGKVTTKKSGKVTITAKVSNVSKKCKITVKANETDISKVLDKKLISAVRALGFKHVKNKDRKSAVALSPSTYVETIDKFYTSNGKFSSSKSYIKGTTYYKNTPGHIYAKIKDKKLSVFEVKIGMKASQSDSNLKKYGWKLLFDGLSLKPDSSAGSRMYCKQSAIINISFKNGKVSEITYQWTLESEF